jgi:DUF2933 family protein
LLTEHTAHVFGVAPYLLILACPVMHTFMHHGIMAIQGRAPSSNPDEEGEGRAAAYGLWGW